MRTVSVRLSDLERAVVPIGFVGENQHTQVRIDCLKLYEEYQHAAASLTVKPPKGDSYPAVVVRDGNTVVWEITDSDLIYDGNGEIQLSFTVDEVVAKSYVGRIKISRSITPTGEVPEPLDDFLTRAGAALTAIPETIAVALQEAKDSGEFDGYSPTVVVTEITRGHQVTVTDVNGDHVFLVMDGVDGDPGTPGFSPSASVSKVGKKATISITDKDGTTTAEVNDGEDGQDGQDGHSPVVTASKSGKVTTVSVDGTAIATINDGNDGQDGDPGATPVISIGTVSTLTPGSDATASMDTTDPAHPVLSLGIPEGEPGEVTEAELFDATHDRWNEDNEPYLFRASGGDASVYEWERDTLVGGTVAWNQLMKDPSLETYVSASRADTSVSDRVMTVTADGTGNAYVFMEATLPSSANHAILLSCDVKIDSGNSGSYVSTTLMTSWSSGSKAIANATPGTWKTISTVVKPTAVPSAFAVYPFGTSATDSGEIVYIRNPIYIDLTQMFGSTIADYIYTLEQGTPGAGIAWLKKHGFMTKPYYAYDAGTLMSGKAESHVTVGFNLWDEEWELGIYDINTGAKVNNTSNIRNKNLIRVLPNTSYCWRNTSSDVIRFVFFDANENYVSYISTSKSGDKYTFTTPANAYFFAFYYGSTTYSNNVCINLSSSRNGEYEPYSAHTYALGSDELRGLFMLDSNNKLYCNGDTKTSDGTINRRYILVDLGTLNWSYSSGSGQMYAMISDMVTTNNNIVVCAKYTQVIVSGWAELTINGTLAVGSGQIRILDTSYTDPATFKTAMSGVYLVCERATPTTESADPFTNPQAVSPYGTEEYTDTRSVPIPVGHETKYLMDAFQYTEQKLSASQTLMELIVTANREEAMKASKAYSSGNLIIVNGTLYRVTTSIANGANLTVGTNVTATTIATELASLA